MNLDGKTPISMRVFSYVCCVRASMPSCKGPDPGIKLIKFSGVLTDSESTCDDDVLVILK